MKPFPEIQLKGIPANLKLNAVTVQKEKSRRTMNFDFSIDASSVKKRKNSDDKIATK